MELRVEKVEGGIERWVVVLCKRLSYTYTLLEAVLVVLSLCPKIYTFTSIF